MALSTQNDFFAPWLDESQQPLVKIRSLIKRFGVFSAIDQIDLDIYRREFFALLGPSGCGKTTLMRMLAGFETPTSGSVMLNNQDLSLIPAHKRPVNMMFQSYALFPHMTVAGNIAFGLKQERQPKEVIAERVEEMLALVQLQKFANRKPNQLSGGQKQRVALARTLAKKPDLVLLDEPLGALDKKLRQETQFELIDIQEKLGLTFVIVTHDQEEAMTVASRIAVMNDGRIMQIDPPMEIYENPKSVFVANFLGDTNMLAGNAEPTEGGKSLLHWAEGKAPFLLKHAVNVSQSATLAIRPEKVMISAEKPTSDYCAVEGTVFDIAYTGNLTIYHVKVAENITLKALQSNTQGQAMLAFTWEDKVWLSWPNHLGSLLTC